MKNLILAILIFTFNIQAAPSPEILTKTNPFIVKVHVSNKQGNHGVGSGVVITKDHIVTNCHVIGDAQGVHVEKFGVSYPPKSFIADWRNDLCILKFAYMDLASAPLGSTMGLRYETPVFTKSYGGNSVRPISSFGYVKGIYNLDGYQIIQSSASFALGASGGGIFNELGELLGITTFKTIGRKAFFYSMSIEKVQDMLINGEEVLLTTQPELPFWDAPQEKQPFFMQVVSHIKSKSWLELKDISEKWLLKDQQAVEPNFNLALAQFHLGKLDKSKKLLKNVINVNERHALAYLYLYKISKKQNMKDESNTYKEKVLLLDETLITE